MIEYLLHEFNAVFPLSDGLKQDLIKHSEVFEIKKKEVLIQSGQQIRHIYFILDGLLRVYYLKDGKEINARFSKEHDVIFSIGAFYSQETEDSTIEAIEDTTIAKLSFEHLANFLQKHLELNYVARVISDKYLLENEKRLFALRKLTTKERWDNFCEQHHDLLKRIPLQYIASYLGMNLETLSRIRKIVA